MFYTMSSGDISEQTGALPPSNFKSTNLFPSFHNMKGHITEVHGSPDAGKTKTVLSYIRTLQKENNVKVLYMDTTNKLQNAGEAAKLDPELTWFMFGTTLGNCSSIECFAKNGIDLLVIDDIVCFNRKLWDIAKRLDRIARQDGLAIILINQLRNVMDHTTGEFVLKPYRFNTIEPYCHYVVDLDRQTTSVSDTDIELGLDAGVKMFL